MGQRLIHFHCTGRHRIHVAAFISLMEELRTRITSEEFDYPILMDSLKDYASPRDKVTDLLRKGSILRVKKGIYVFGKAFSRGALSREILANMIYGLSCVSLDYALHFHGLIPERVAAMHSPFCGE